MSLLGNTTESASHELRALRHRIGPYALQEVTWKLLPDRPRLTACCRITGKGKKPSIVRHHGHGGSVVSIGGLARCGSVWTCPVCAKAASRRRSGEISNAIQQHHDLGGLVFFVTETFSHGREDVLADQVQKQAAAARRMRSGARWQRFKKRYGIVGQIKALEVTHSERNGWHPHHHEIFFCGPDADPEAFLDELYEMWAAACERENLGKPSREHGVNLRVVDPADKDAISRYPVFGADLDRASYELASGSTKSGKGSDSRTPWDLLLHAATGDKRAAWLWKEFVDAFWGRASLFWSRGLKAHFGIDDISDADAAIEEAEEQESESDTICDLAGWQFILLRKYKAFDTVCRLADVFGSSAVSWFCRQLQKHSDAKLKVRINVRPQKPVSGWEALHRQQMGAYAFRNSMTVNEVMYGTSA